MSSFVRIAFAAPKATAEKIRAGLPEGAELMEVEGYPTEGASHLIFTDLNFYAPGYETGPWPEIETLLLLIFDQPETEKVWYGSDMDEGMHEPITCDEVKAFGRHFLEVGNR